jgi:DNA-binding NarL/FixJ family response regulator
VIPSSLKILIVEDQGMVAQLLVDWCNSQLRRRLALAHGSWNDSRSDIEFHFKCAGTGRIGSEHIHSWRPHLIIVDVQLPDGNGIEFADAWKGGNSNLRIVGFSGQLSEWSVWQASTSQLDGFVTKSHSGLNEMCDILLRVLAGERRFCQRFQEMRQQVLRNPESMSHQLSTRELTALKAVIEGLDDQEIGARLDVSPATARKHRQSLMKKFDVSSSPKLVAAGVRWGLQPTGVGMPFEET